MSNFLKLNEFASILGVTRQTASKKLKNNEYPSFSKNNVFKIPSFFEDLKNIEEYEAETFSDKHKCFTFLIGNNKGGSGKTTSSINIASSIAFYGKKVLLVDMDNQSNASTINKLHIENDFDKRNITKILLEMRDYEEGQLEVELSKTIVNVQSEHFKVGKFDLLPNSLEWDIEKEALFNYSNAENILNRLLKKLKNDYDFIIIDTSPSMDITWRMSVMASDAMIIGMKPEQYSIEGLGGVYKRIYRLNEDYKEIKGHNIEVLGAIITDYKKQTNIAKLNMPTIENALHKYSRYNNSILLLPAISHSIKASEQQSQDGPIMFDDTSSNMNLEYLELTKNIITQLYFLDSERN